MDDIRYHRGHQLPLTCVTVTSDSKFVFSGAKDCSIIKCEDGCSTHTYYWCTGPTVLFFLSTQTLVCAVPNILTLSLSLPSPITPSPLLPGYLESGQKCCVLPGHRKGLSGSVCHTGHVLALAVSSDDKFLVSLNCRTSLTEHYPCLRAPYCCWQL